MLYTVDNDGPPSSPVPSSQPIHNDTFYLDSITFQVEDELFKIPIRLISFTTEPFQTLAARSLPSGNDSTEGMSDETPIILPDTSKVDFQRLLQVICPLDFEPKPITSVDVWSSTLKLSTKWRLLGVRNLAIRKMSRLNLTNGDLVRFGREYKVEDWLVKGYFGFATQDFPLSLADVKDVIRGLEIDEGLNQIVKLAGLREKDRSEKPWSFSPTPPSPEPAPPPSLSAKSAFWQERSKRGKSPPTPPPPIRTSPIHGPYAAEKHEFKEVGGLKMASIRTVFKAEVDEVVMFEKYLNLEI